MLEKWSLDKSECVGSVQEGSVQGSYWCLPDASMTPAEPVWRELEAALISGRMNGANNDMMNTVKVSVIFSTAASRPGIFSMIEVSFRTTLSRKARMG